MRTQDRVDTACDQALANLRAALGDRLVAVALFGSAARRPDGDWGDLDLYAIVRDLPRDVSARDRLLYDAPGRLEPWVDCSVIGRTPEEFERDVTPLMLDLALDARLLFDPSGYLAERLEKLRGLIADAALTRAELEPGEFSWRFGRPPQGPWEFTWNGYREIRE